MRRRSRATSPGRCQATNAAQRDYANDPARLGCTENITKFLGEFGRVALEAAVAAGENQELTSQLIGEGAPCDVGRLALGLLAYTADDPDTSVLQRFEIGLVKADRTHCVSEPEVHVALKHLLARDLLGR